MGLDQLNPQKTKRSDQSNGRFFFYLFFIWIVTRKIKLKIPNFWGFLFFSRE